MQNNLQHVGVLGMHWGVRKARPNASDAAKTSNHFNRSLRQKYGVEVFKKPSAKPNAGVSKQSHFSRSLEQKYGHKTVSSLMSAVKPKAIAAAKTVVKAYVAYKATEFVVSSIPKVAWATGKIISNTPLG